MHVDPSLGFRTGVGVAVVRPQPHNGASHGWIDKCGTTVDTKSLKFAERRVFGGTSFRADEKKRACHAFSVTIRKCQKDKKGLIADYFSDDSSPEREKELKRLQTAGPKAGDRGR
jgi:hypothetical protein